MKETEKANKNFKIWYALNCYLQNSLLYSHHKPNQTLATSSHQVTFSKYDKAQKYPDVGRTPSSRWTPVHLWLTGDQCYCLLD